jgi:DNA invertase Pin-like site-specific DNA recombinase
LSTFDARNVFFIGSNAVQTYVAYFRVSTQRQGASGLGLDAQKHAVEAFARGHHIVETFTEVESGKNCDRPQLAAAIARCRATGATLLVAKLDRLARDVHFVAGLMKAGVEFVACDMPHANRLTVHILAAVAEDEARRISERTKAALAAAKARGVTLGGFRGRHLTDTERAAGNAAKTAKARARAMSLKPVIDDVRACGAVTLCDVAKSLTARGIPAPRGGVWQATQVSRVLAHLTA